MKKIMTMIALITPLFASTARAGLNANAVETLAEVNLVRQPEVEKCFKQFEQGGGVPMISSIKHTAAEDADRYVISGSTRFGRNYGGNWEITVDVSSGGPDGPTYGCTITKNEE